MPTWHNTAAFDRSPQLLQAGFDQLAKMLFQAGLEIGRIVEGLKGGDECAVCSMEEPLHELIEQNLLLGAA